MFTCGFETQHLGVLAADFLSTTSAEGQLSGAFAGHDTAKMSVDTTVARSGAACLRANTRSATQGFWEVVIPGPGVDKTFYLRVYFRKAATETGAALAIVGFAQGGDYVDDAYHVRLNTDDTLTFRWGNDSNVTIGAPSAPLANGQWYCIEIKSLITAGGAGSGEFRLDGVTVASETAVAGRGAANYPRRVLLGGDGSGPAGTLYHYWDDMALNDATVPAGFTAGDYGAQDTWPGEGKVFLLAPTGDSARHAEWLAGAGGTTSLFEALNNRPPAGLSTPTNASQIKHVTVGGAAEDYDATLQSYTVGGVPADEQVKLVQTLVNAGSDASVAGMGALKVVSGPAEAAETTFDPFNVQSPANFPAGWKAQRGPVLYVPGAGGADTPVVRVGKRGASASVMHADLLGLYVESGTPGLGQGLVMVV